MSGKILWTGLTVVTCAQVFNWDHMVAVVGAIIMFVGVVLFVLDK